MHVQQTNTLTDENISIQTDTDLCKLQFNDTIIAETIGVAAVAPPLFRLRTSTVRVQAVAEAYRRIDTSDIVEFTHEAKPKSIEVQGH